MGCIIGLVCIWYIGYYKFDVVVNIKMIVEWLYYFDIGIGSRR